MGGTRRDGVYWGVGHDHAVLGVLREQWDLGVELGGVLGGFGWGGWGSPSTPARPRSGSEAGTFLLEVLVVSGNCQKLEKGGEGGRSRGGGCGLPVLQCHRSLALVSHNAPSPNLSIRI